jgi:hypothetical protein
VLKNTNITAETSIEIAKQTFTNENNNQKYSLKNSYTNSRNNCKNSRRQIVRRNLCAAEVTEIT